MVGFVQKGVEPAPVRNTVQCIHRHVHDKQQKQRIEYQRTGAGIGAEGDDPFSPQPPSGNGHDGVEQHRRSSEHYLHRLGPLRRIRYTAQREDPEHQASGHDCKQEDQEVLGEK